MEENNNIFEPRIIAFVCNWCTYAGADLTGTSRIKYASNVEIVRFPCTGRIDFMLLLKAFGNPEDSSLNTYVFSLHDNIFIFREFYIQCIIYCIDHIHYLHCLLLLFLIIESALFPLKEAVILVLLLQQVIGHLRIEMDKHILLFVLPEVLCFYELPVYLLPVLWKNFLFLLITP